MEKDNRILSQYDNAIKDKVKPPWACSFSWIKKFITKARESKISKVDPSWVRINIVSSDNEYKVIGALEFLNIIDENGNVTDNLKLLLKTGEEYKNGFRKIVENAYKDLFDKVPLNSATLDNLINYFVEYFDYNLQQAKKATKFFISLATEAGIEIPQELRKKVPGAGKEMKIRKNKTKKAESVTVTKRGTKSGMLTNIQVNINIVLDKETPIEMWQAILKLLGLEKE
jgi:hypothetical protein